MAYRTGKIARLLWERACDKSSEIMHLPFFSALCGNYWGFRLSLRIYFSSASSADGIGLGGIKPQHTVYCRLKD